MKKFFTALFAVIFIAMSCLSFTACANPFNDEEDGKDHVDGKITLKVAVLNSDNEKSAMRALKKAYQYKDHAQRLRQLHSGFRKDSLHVP